jgi:hypothetical protein
MTSITHKHAMLSSHAQYIHEHQHAIKNIHTLHTIVSEYFNDDDLDITECCTEQSYIPSYTDCSFAIMLEHAHIIVCDPNYTHFGHLTPHKEAWAYIIYSDYTTNTLTHTPIYNITELIPFLYKKIEILSSSYLEPTLTQPPTLTPL